MTRYERKYTKEQVSVIVRNRVKRLNERIAELEIENEILRSEIEEYEATDE